MKIISFNINGMRARPHQLEEIKKKYDPDVIALQEIKVSDEDFPPEIPESLGFKYFNYGQKSFHGVAIFSKEEPIKVVKGLDGGKDEEQKRFIQCDYETEIGTISICNSYFPQGENRKHPLKFPYKDRYYKRITEYLSGLDNHIVLTGDFNIAPFENDVWSHKSLLNVVSHTKAETNYFSKLLKHGIFEDIIRNNFKQDKKIYSWWSYRNKDWKKSNRGRRLDHILISKNTVIQI